MKPNIQSNIPAALYATFSALILQEDTLLNTTIKLRILSAKFKLYCKAKTELSLAK